MHLFSILKAKFQNNRNAEQKNCEKDVEKVTTKVPEATGRIGIFMAAIFIHNSLSGCGFLILPRAMANAGWFALLILFIIICFTMYVVTRLATCRLILEERWPEYTSSIRKPYMEIGYRAYGEFGRVAVSSTILIALSGSGTVGLLMTSQFFSAVFPALSQCQGLVIIAIALIPMSWLGSPKDLWQVSVLSLITTAVGCIIITTDLASRSEDFSPPKPISYSFESFLLAIGTIIYTLGIGSSVSIVQNDMRDKRQYYKSVNLGMTSLIILYVPLSIISHMVLGSDVPDNILLYDENQESIVVKIASFMTIANMIFNFLMCVNPVSLFIEESINIPNYFCLKRIVLRTAIILGMLLVALAFPDLGLVVNLLGGLTVSFNTYVFPSIFYLKLVKDSDQNPNWPKRALPKWEVGLLWFIAIIGIIVCLFVTSTAVKNLLGATFTESCFTKICFHLGNSTGVQELPNS